MVSLLLAVLGLALEGFRLIQSWLAAHPNIRDIIQATMFLQNLVLQEGVVPSILSSALGMLVSSSNEQQATVAASSSSCCNDEEEPILIDMVQQFLDHHGFDSPEHNDLYGDSPLHRACCNKTDSDHATDTSSPTRFFSNRDKRAQLVRYILTYGGTRQLMSKDNSNGWVPLHHALCCDMLVSIMLTEFHANANATDYTGQTALHLISRDGMWSVPKEDRTGDLAVLQMLLDHGADLEARDMDGWTPLLRACLEGNAPVVKFLLQHGANVRCRATESRTPLHLLLQTHRNGPFRASDIREIVELCVARGADVNAQDKYGFTPLHQATLKGRGDIVRYLMQHGGADASLTTNDHHMTALLLASHHDQFETFQVLLEYNNNNTSSSCDNDLLSAVTLSGNTVLHLATTAPLAQCILENTTFSSAKDRAQLLHRKNQAGQTPLEFVKQRLQEDGSEAEMVRYAQLEEYLESYTEASLAVPPSGRNNNNNHDPSVMLNPTLNEFQRVFAKKTHKLIDSTNVHECTYIIMGYLSPADVMKQ